MEYKGYLAQYSFDERLEIFQGKVSNVSAVVAFQGKSLETLQLAFQKAVDDYLAFCKNFGNPPAKPPPANKIPA